MQVIPIGKQDYTVYNLAPTMGEEKVTAHQQHVDSPKSDETTTFAIPAFIITLDVNKAIDALCPMLGGAIIPASIFAVGMGGLLLMVLATALLR